MGEKIKGLRGGWSKARGKILAKKMIEAEARKYAR